MPNCSVMMFWQGTVVGNEVMESFDDDFTNTITTAVARARPEQEPDMVIVWLGIRAFGFWYSGPFRVKPMCFRLLNKLQLCGTDLVWPKGCIVAGIPAFNQPNWYEEQKFFIDHPYRTRVCEHSEMFGITDDPETILITYEEIRWYQVEIVY